MVALLGAASSLAAPPAAAAETPAPGFEAIASTSPTVLSPGEEGAHLSIYVYDVGGEASAGPIRVVDRLPSGLEAVPAGPCAGTTVVTCEIEGTEESPTSFPPAYEPERITIVLKVEPSAPVSGSAVDTIELSGGGAPTTNVTRVPITFGTGIPPLGFSDADDWASSAEGAADLQAGSHPFSATAVFAMNRAFESLGQDEPTGGQIRGIDVNLPPGLIGNPTAVPTCPRSVFDGGETAEQDGSGCPASTMIGTTVPGAKGLGTPHFPVFNLQPPRGVAAEFGYSITGPTSVLIDAEVRPGDVPGGYSLTEHVANAPEREATFSSVTLWGVPGSPLHDLVRHGEGFGPGCIPDAGGGCGVEPSLIKPFLTLPTSCSGPVTVSDAITSTWQDESAHASFPITTHNLQDEPAGGEDCAAVPFTPSITARPTESRADSPTGLDFDLHLPQNEEPEGLAEAELKSTTVTLPEGLVLDPASANGQGACSEAQVGYEGPGTAVAYEFGPEPAACPGSSSLGTVEIDTPDVDHPLPGTIYLARQKENPFGSDFAIYIAVYDPARGIVIKLPAEVTPDPQTGRLTTTVTESPQLPFEDFHLDFRSGNQAPLQTPQGCSPSLTTTSTLVPWTAPEGADAHPTDSFPVSQGAGGGACAGSEASSSNHPALQAGTVTPVAGAYSPFVLKVSREDGTQRLSKIEATLPPGMTGKLAGIPYCPQSDIAQAQSRSHSGEGAIEQAHPSCPAASEVGTVTVASGAGPEPISVSGHAYLAGPYEGAPLSLAIVTPAIAGPFDLGTVVVRTALNVDPLTAQIKAVSDPLPRILDGIPLDIRSVAIDMDRPQFTINPTNCERSAVLGDITSLTGNIAALTEPSQVGGCQNLGFRPRLAISLSGQTHRAGHPALKAVLTYSAQGAYANIARAQVDLPHSEFIDQANLDKTCTRPVLLEGKCPARSIYGHAKAWTPLLEAPLEGPVYLVGGFGYKLPALVAELDGQIRVLLVGKVDSGKNHGIRNTFEAVPDAPVSRFVLQMKGGKKYSLLENSEDICARTEKASASFVAQDGDALTLHPKIAVRCGKAAAKKRHGRRHHGHHQKGH